MRLAGTAPDSVERDKQFHQVIVGGIGRRLDDEDILAPDILLNFDETFHV